jgi:hypothetical protein
VIIISDPSLPTVFPTLPPNERNVRDVRLGTAFVYIIQDGDAGPIKIGWAINPFERLKHLQVGNPRRMRLIHYEEAYDRYDARRLEREIHCEFLGHRVHGEWFRLVGSVYRFMLHCHRGASIQDIVSGWSAAPLREEVRDGAEFTDDADDQ